MLRSLPALVLLATVAAASAAQRPLQVDPASIEWKDAPSMPAGTKMAVLEGDPARAEIFTLRLLVPAGTRLASHWHPRDERVTVLSGTAVVNFDDDPSASKAFDRGGFYVTPPRVRHSLFFPVETVLQLTGIGPWEVVPAAAKSGKATGSVQIVAVSPAEGTIVDEETVIVIEVEYSVEPFQAETFRLTAQFDTKTPGRTMSIGHAIITTSPIAPLPRDGILARSRGRETIRLPLRDILSRGELAKPLRVRVLLNEMVSDVRSESVADSRVIEFPVK
jgi:mannose-6-phosphate isomerase-like protein (cupin superfamily)